ncbi:MAG: hypothetical protein K0S56_359 [Microvirga sp.]|jgi:hypothetical protein|nr:hypothetical protein [Microvirga sp.]
MADDAEGAPAAVGARTIVWDALAVLGVALVVAGISMMHVPSALIAAGMAFIVVAVLGARRS